MLHSLLSDKNIVITINMRYLVVKSDYNDDDGGRICICDSWDQEFKWT